MPKQVPMVFAGVRSPTMAANLVSDWFHKENLHCGGMLKWAADPAETLDATGAFTFELSFDAVNVARTLAASDFSPALTEPAAAPGITDFTMSCAEPYVRLKYTATSGDGVFDGIFNSMES